MVRSLSEVVKRATTDRVQRLNKQLVDKLVASDAELSDVYAIGLKTIINDCDGTTIQVVGDAILAPLTSVVGSASPELTLQVLDLLAALLQRPELAIRVEIGGRLLECFLLQLSATDAASKKKATVALGALSPHLGDDLLDTMVGSILSTVGKSGSGATTLVQVLGAVSRRVGWRLGRHLDAIVPVLTTAVGSVDDPAMHSDDACELRETCLHAMESLVLRCPAEVQAHMDDVEDLARGFLAFDPNYNYGDDEDEDAEPGDGDEDGGDDDYGDEYGDDYGDEYGGDEDADDESSWKVRRAAARLLTAAVATRPERLRSYYQDGLASTVLSCFRERDENVKLEMIGCLTALLRATVVADGSVPETMPNRLLEAESENLGPSASMEGRGLSGTASASASAAAAAATSSSSSSSSSRGSLVRGAPQVRAAAQAGLMVAPSLVRQFSVALDTLPEMLPEIVAKALKQAAAAKAGRGSRVRSAVLQMFRQLCLVLGAEVEGELPGIVQAALAALTDSVASLRLEGLETIRTALDTVPHGSWAGLLPEVVPAVTAAASDEWYKCVAESLRVCGRLIVATTHDDADAAAAVPPIEAAVIARLGEVEADQEVKEAAILAGGLLVAYASAQLGSGSSASILATLLERLRNEVTRNCTLKALAFVAASDTSVDMAAVLEPIASEVATLLRQKSRATRQAALACLEAIISSRGAALSEGVLKAAFAEAATMISDADLSLADRALHAATAMTRMVPQATSAAVLTGTPLLAQAVALAGSPVLHGHALSALTAFLPAAAACASKSADDALAANNIVTAIAAPLTSADALPGSAAAAAASSSSSAAAAAGASSSGTRVAKQAIANAARCIASLVASGGAASTAEEVRAFTADATASGTGHANRLLALFALGELGGGGADILAIEAGALDAVAALFDDTSAGVTEDVKSAAAAAIGGIVTGSPSKGMPWLKAALAGATSRPKYLLLAALKAVLGRHAPFTTGGASFAAHATDAALIGAVEMLADDADTSVRAMAGEVLGRLAASAPDTIVESITRLATDASSATRRAAAAVAFKFAVASNARVEASAATVCLETALDEDIAVKLAGLQAINMVINSAPGLVAALLRIEPPALDAAGKSPEAERPIETCGVQAVVMAATQVRPDLQREVDMGPFKQKVDDGLPLRKAAFGCLDAIFDQANERIPPTVLISRICDGLRDSDDVMILAHQLLIKVVSNSVWGRHILAALPDIISALRTAFEKADAAAAGAAAAKKAKSSEGRGTDVMRSALRVLSHIGDSLPEASSVPAFAGALDHYAAHATLGPMLLSIKEGAGAASAFSS